MDAMRRVVLWGFALGLGTVLASVFPDIKRYIKMTRM
jgi:hypothetical protein